MAELVKGIIEKVPRGIQGEMSSKGTTSSENWSQQLEQKQDKKWDGTRCPDG